MYRLKKVILGAAAAALTVTALGAPAAAVDDKGTLAIVNGRPATKVDVCFGSKEKKSGLPYGGVYQKDVIGTGPMVLKFYKKDSRTCRGTLLAKKTLSIAAGTDLTVVLTKKTPMKVVVFDNVSPLYIGEIPPRGAPYTLGIMAWNHAAEFPVNFHYRFWGPDIPDTPIGLSANPVSTKGSRLVAGSPIDYYWRVRATRLESPTSIASRSAFIKASRRYEWILVGSNPSNALMVLIDRGISQPSP